MNCVKRKACVISCSNMHILCYKHTICAKKTPQVMAVIEADTLFKLLEPDGIPAIRIPEFVSGKEAQDQMSSNEPVMGLIINGEARAYSLWQLDHHEIVNDYFGDLPVAVTW